jgi:transposase
VKAAEKPAQPIEKSTAGASLLAHVIVAKWADHQPLHRQQQMLARHGVEISRKTMGGWLAQCAGLLEALYGAAKKELFASHVVGTDDTGVKVLDRKLPFARTGRIWPYVGDERHPVIVYDYTPTRARAGRAKALELTAEQRRQLRRRVSSPVMEKLHAYLVELKQQVLPKSPSGAAVRYALNQWQALNVYLEDGELEIDNGATERASRDIAVGRGNWTFFGSDAGGRTAAILRTFIASCKRNGVEPFAWFRDVLSRIGAHPLNRIVELLPHNWKPLTANA